MLIKRLFVASIILGLLTACAIAAPVNTKEDSFITSKYAGTYSYAENTDIEKGFIGSLKVCPETNDTVLFYLDVNRGAPSYNSGTTYGRMEIKDNIGYYKSKAYPDCDLKFVFDANSVKIESTNWNQCGWGGNVTANGLYLQESSATPSTFSTMEGTTHEINSQTLEEWERE